MNERIDALRANRLANEQWQAEAKRLDAEDQEIFRYRREHEEKMLAATHALTSLQQRQASTHARPAEHLRLAEKLAPQCLKDALIRIGAEIEARTNVGKITSGSNPMLLVGPMYRLPTPAEVAARERAEAAKRKLENLYTVEEDIEPLIVKIFADMRQADNAAEQAELQSVQVSSGRKKAKSATLAERESLALAVAGTFGDDGIGAEIEA